MMMKMKISQNVCSGQATSAQRRAVTIPMATSEKSSHSAPEVPAGKFRRKPCIYVLKDHQQPAACSVHRGLHDVHVDVQSDIKHIANFHRVHIVCGERDGVLCSEK